MATCTNENEGSLGWYLKTLSPLMTEEVIKTRCYRRGMPPETPLDSVDERVIDLTTADLYMWLITSPSVGGTVKDADGDWSHSESGYTTSSFDKDWLYKMAKSLYAKWGEEIPSGSSSIKLINF